MSKRIVATLRRMFVQRKQPATGKMEWEVVESLTDDTEKQRNGMKDLMATSFFLDMLNDSYRNTCFAKALSKVVKRGDQVLDIGTGSGLLSLFAARSLKGAGPCNVSTGSIVACEVFPPMADLAQQIIDRNSLTDLIRVLNARSDELDVKSYGNSFDVVVTEIFDSELLGEGLLSTMRHAMKHFAKESATVIPFKATVYCQLVQSPIMRLWNEKDLNKYKMYPLKESDLSPLFPQHLKPLSPPVQAFEFILSQPPLSDRSVQLQVPICDDGTVDCLVFWWTLDCDTDGQIQLSTKPKWIEPLVPEQQWRQHWKQCWAPLPSIYVQNGSSVLLNCHHDDLNFVFGLGTDTKPDLSSVNACHTDPRRLWESADVQRKERYRETLKFILQDMEQSSNDGSGLQILILGEDSIFTELFHEEKSRVQNLCVTIVQDSVAGFKRWSAWAAEQSVDQCVFHCVQQSNLFQDLSQKFSCVLSEPFFRDAAGCEPWMHYLRFKDYLTQLHAAGRLAPGCRIFPSKCRLLCCGASLPELYRTRLPLSKIDELDLSVLNYALGAVGPGLAPLASFGINLWQCGIGFQALTKKSQVWEDSIHNFASTFQFKQAVNLSFNQQGTCHAIVAWTEYNFPSATDNDASAAESPKAVPDYSIYGICLLAEPITMDLEVSNAGERFQLRCLSLHHDKQSCFIPSAGTAVIPL